MGLLLVLLVEFISIWIDKTAKHALGYKFFCRLCEVAKIFLSCLLIAVCKWELVTDLLLVDFISVVIDQTCSWMPGFCGDCAQLLKYFFEFVYA